MLSHQIQDGFFAGYLTLTFTEAKLELFNTFIELDKDLELPSGIECGFHWIASSADNEERAALHPQMALYYYINWVKDQSDKITNEDFNLIISIFEPFLETLKDAWDETWNQKGLAVFYLKWANVEANSGHLNELVKIDKKLGWFCGKKELEDWIVTYKEAKIIPNETVSYK